MQIKHVLFLLTAILCTLTTAAQELSYRPNRPDRRALLPPERAARRMAVQQDKGPGGSYFTGEKHQLVVLASFEDNPFLGDESATIAQWDKILNTEHLNEPPFQGSFHDYFDAQSNGQFDLICDLQFVRVGNRARYRSTYTNDENSQYLVLDIIDSLALRDIHWNLYDWNGDGYVNQLLIIYAGQGSSYGGMGPSSDAIWPHQWWLSEHIDPQKGVHCSPDTIRYQNKDYILDAYCVVQELTKDSTYGTFGTLCHEYTHCFGFPDIYSYSINTTPHSWDVMDYGAYNGDGFVPTAYSAHERWLMGWLTPVELKETTVITDMPALTDEPVAYLVRNEGYPNEYYILENRQQQGWDAMLPGAGLVVFHIDYDPVIWLTGYCNTTEAEHYMMIPANNQENYQYSEGWAYPYEDNNQLTDDSEPAAILWHANTDGQYRMSKSITDISMKDGLVSFTFTPHTPQGIFTPASSELTRKELHKGQILIFHNGKCVNVMGTEIKK